VVKGFFRRVYKGRWGYFFILPAYFFFAWFTLIPLYEGLKLSFYRSTLRGLTYVGLDNFRRLLSDEAFHYALRNTVIFVLIVVPLVLAISLMLALAIFPMSKRWQSVYRFAFYLPAVASSVVLSMVWLWIYNPTYGLLNYLTGLIGIEPIAWLGTVEWALPALALVVVTWTIGQPVILFIAALGAIPNDYFEAAKIDGATGWQTFWKVTLPLLRPTALFVLITQTIGVFQVFVVVLLLTRGGPAHSTQTIVYRIYETAFQFFDFGYAAAMSGVLLVLVGLIAVLQYRFLGREVEY